MNSHGDERLRNLLAVSDDFGLARSCTYVFGTLTVEIDAVKWRMLFNSERRHFLGRVLAAAKGLGCTSVQIPSVGVTYPGYDPGDDPVPLKHPLPHARAMQKEREYEEEAQRLRLENQRLQREESRVKQALRDKAEASVVEAQTRYVRALNGGNAADTATGDQPSTSGDLVAESAATLANAAFGLMCDGQRSVTRSTFEPTSRTLRLEMQLPLLSAFTDTAAGLQDARRNIAAGLWHGIMRALAPREARLRRLYFDAFVVRPGRLTGEFRRQYLASVCVTDDNADMLLSEGTDRYQLLAKAGARVALDPAQDSIAPIQPMGPSVIDGGDAATQSFVDTTPSGFEGLIAALFRKRGFEVEQTPASWDRGVDCIAIDPRPLVGGKVLIQVKRYSGTVDVSVVRDLYGIVLSTGASKGIVVTTGTFGPTSREFVREKPLELIDGALLQELLREYNG